MLNLKTGHCPSCNNGKDVPLVKGYCRAHYWSGLREETVTRQIENGGMRRNIRIYTAEEKKSLDEWFEYHLNNSWHICENCREPTIEYGKSAHAHILPKNKFESVKTVIDNHLMLCDFCHIKYDTGWETAATMPVIVIATQRFLTFMHLIASDEIKHLPEYFKTLLINEQQES